MKVTQSSFFRKYLLPGIIFQSVVIAGGYGTGRELVEFFLSFGPGGGLLAMLISTIMWSIVCAATFEFARVFRAYEYRIFFKKLLGRFWFLFEACYIALLIIILAVVASSAGEILQKTIGLHYYFGVLGIMIGAGILVFLGGKIIEIIFSYWSFFLYTVFFLFVVFSFTNFGEQILANLSECIIKKDWVIGGFQYAFYNLGVIPVVLFATKYIETRKEAVWAGGLAGVIGIIPGFLLTLAMIGQYPGIIDETVPTNFVLEILGSPLFQLAYQIMLFGTLIETSSGCIHAVNNRIQSVFDQRNVTMPSWIRPLVAIAFLILGAAIAQFGLINLIAQGYGTIAWGFMIVFVIPLLTLGVWKSHKTQKTLTGLHTHRSFQN